MYSSYLFFVYDDRVFDHGGVDDDDVDDGGVPCYSARP